MGFVTIRDVARQAGVSITAVSQILHGKGRFSQETRDLVQRTVDELGYIPDSRAQAIRSSRSKTVGLLVPDIRNPFFADLVCSVEEMLHEKGYSTLIGTSAEDVNRQDAFINTLLGYRIDGAIVVPQGVQSPGIDMLVDQDLPLVFVDRRVQGVDSVPFVVSDPYTGLQEALDTLHQLGHRRIGYVAHPSLGSFSVNERETAFREIAAGLFDQEPTIVACDNTFASRKQALVELLAADVTAIVFAYSPDAIALIGLLHDRSIDIGTDVSVVSFDDIDAFKLMTPQIAIISQQVGDMGRQGVEMLLARIDAKRKRRAENRRIPTVFVQRGSVCVAPVG
ncbi:LacI family DNA-binding transcriptional regulator [Bifidobacterium phasiani]|uniref:LacI family DNA-binding transcriptional regulator n=1 Tax=Bifidobacterium phasiani TaxID=2834431 RepID=A0ABS6W9A6_9BIFI|nr:LacI family DNA-binding transcriptional regulator [Bifidobacterium phasiani]MBW3083091.1 LacI family DNA-binding transcriptional regulator [Bifidobacterium phasiani]